MLRNALIGEAEITLEKEILSEIRALSTPTADYHLLWNNRNYEGKILSIDPISKLVTVSVNGSVYEVKLRNDLDLSIAEMGFKSTSDKVDNLVVAPMPGLVLDILVEEGQKVEKGQALLILEAMKMENVLKADKDGVISRIAIDKGAAVEKKALLIEMEL